MSQRSSDGLWFMPLDTTTRPCSWVRTAACWLATPELDGILAAAGFRYSLTFATLRDLRTGRACSIPALGYMGAGAAQERLVGLERRVLLAGRGAFPVLRVFLHPAGARRSAACRATLDALERLCRERRPVTYADLVRGCGSGR